ncbi:MAG: hypothetical protein D4R72_06795 [Nitrosopumilales archaeon]|nr:MAG: hypothetical protein D4R72_06795 [Nitrosopumilales archaeon]
MKTTVLLFSIVILLICHMLEVEAIQVNQTACDQTQISDCTEQNVIVQKQDKQIANLTDQVIGYKNAENENSTWKNIGVAFGIIGSIATTISTVYGIKKKREISRLQSKTEKAKEKSYRAKTEAEKARKAEHTTGAIKNFFDLFRK